jgi:hypothetical protein
MIAPNSRGGGNLSKSMDFGAPNLSSLSSMSLMDDSKTAKDFLPIKFDRAAMKEKRMKNMKSC